MNWTDKVSELPEGVRPEDVLFAWTVKDDYPRFNEHEDIAAAYIVQSEPQADFGVMIWARYRGEWVVNPYSTRALVRKLTALITPPAQGEERDPAYCYYCDNLMDEPTGNACSACNARVLKDTKEPRSNEPVVLPPDLDCSAMPVVDIEAALADALEGVTQFLAEHQTFEWGDVRSELLAKARAALELRRHQCQNARAIVSRELNRLSAKWCDSGRDCI